MHWRFWRRFRIAPLTTLNVSKSGFSVSFGIRGLHFTTGPRSSRFTAGLPGTGLSLSHQVVKRRKARQQTDDWAKRLIRAQAVFQTRSDSSGAAPREQRRKGSTDQDGD